MMNTDPNNGAQLLICFYKEKYYFRLPKSIFFNQNYYFSTSFLPITNFFLPSYLAFTNTI